MNIDELADHIARRCIVNHMTPYFVAVTQHQQEKVIEACKAQLIEILKPYIPCEKP